MNYFPMMTEDEIKYVCSVIPLHDSVSYFKRYPKDFAQIMPGFRAESLKDHGKVSAVLFRNRNHPFVYSFIENHISHWMDEIKNEITSRADKGESKESAWLHTLPFCFFVDDISIYFKLIGEDYSKEYISLLSESIKLISTIYNSKQSLETGLKDIEVEREHLKNEIEHVYNDLDISNKKNIEYFSEIKDLKIINGDLEKLIDVVRSGEQEIVDLRNKLNERNELILILKDELTTVKDKQQELERKIRKQIEDEQIIMDLKNKLNERNELILILKDELTTIKDKQQELERKIRKQIEDEQTANYYELAVSYNPRHPRDMEEFREFLGYNFESIGVSASTEYFPLLKDYLCEILFAGKPILVSRCNVSAVIKCVSNSLIGSGNVVPLVFKSGISEEEIHEYLSSKNRILCLDNFIGNFNETILVAICDKHKDKIIFATVSYDRTLRYVPEEFLKYCHYLNLNRIEAFTCDRALSEDPSTFDEVEVSESVITPSIRWAPFLKDMLDEFGISNTFATYKSRLISDEARLCQLLAFDILPFCVDVLEIHPFNISERLNKYAGDTGRCSYKELFRRWFS